MLLCLAASPAAAVDWYTGSKPIEAPRSDLFNTAKPLPSTENWIIADAPKKAEPVVADREKAGNFSAISMRGPSATVPVRTPGLLIKRNGDETSTEYSAPEQSTQYAVDISVGATARNSLSTTVGFTSGAGRKLEQTGPRYHAELQIDAPCCFGRTISFAGSQTVQFGASAMLGYEWIGEKGSLAGYVGANMTNVSKQMLGTESGVGLQTSADMSFNPTEKFMISVGGTFSTLNTAYYSRAKIGVAVYDGVYIGPEAVLIGDRHGSQTRYGAFISGIKIQRLQFGVAGGYAIDRRRGNGVYSSLDMRAAF